MPSALGGWLQLREAADWSARSDSLVARVLTRLARVDPVRILDLASGAGSNVRYLAPRLPARQRWTVVDRDASLLAEARIHLAAWASASGVALRGDRTGCHLRGSTTEWTVTMHQRDLGSLEAGLFDGCHLVTASALLDLTSEAWIRDLAARCRAAGAGVLVALTYDGRFSCEPGEVEDETVRELFNAHQRTDKGLGGPAAGPAAHAAAERAFAGAGYEVATEPSDWRLDPGSRALQRPLIDGWAVAATEMAPRQAAAIEQWRLRRQAHVEAGRSRLVVGHHDLAAWLPSSAGA
jgi:hypothetical protein